MIKALVIIRTSTVRQEIEAQMQEICSYASTFGYKEEELKVIGNRGASAIKLDDLYLKNLKTVYRLIEENPSIEKVFAWSLDRIARDEVVFMEFKNFLISHRINLIIKNPSLFLLNDDGSVNNGMEIAINLFCTMAKQEMLVKKDRFMRAKRYISAQGKFIGARYMMYGYTVDSNGFIIINPDEASTVKLIFDLYSSEKLSAKGVAQELTERGIKHRNTKFSEGQVLNILKNEAYIGHSDKNKLIKSYPVIIDEAQFNKVKSIRESKNSRLIKSTKHISLALKILKCWECGANYMYIMLGSRGKPEMKYVCYNRAKKYRLNVKDICTSSCAVQAKVMDEILTDLVFQVRSTYNEVYNKKVKEDLKNKSILLNTKIENIKYEIEHLNKRFGKLVDAWTNEIITDEMYNSRVEKLKSIQENYNTSLNQYKLELEDTNDSINRIDGNDEIIEFVDNGVKVKTSKSIYNYYKEKENPEILKSLINKYIKVAYAKAIKVNNTNLTIIMVADFNNNIYNTVFHQKHGVREGMYKYNIEKNLLTTYHNNYHKIAENLTFIQDEDKVNFKTSTAIKNIMESPEAMIELHNKIEDLNKQMIEKIK